MYKVFNIQDQFDCIDFSDNEIRKLSNFPQMKRLTTILANNNYISRIGALGETLAEVTALILTNNRVSSLSEIDHIATLAKLEHLSLIDNPVVLKANFRQYVIYRIPSLKSLDYKKVQLAERQAATKYFKSVLGKALLSDIAGEGAGEEPSVASSGPVRPPEPSKPPVVLTEDEKRRVREAIESATSKEEIDLIEKRLKVSELC